MASKKPKPAQPRKPGPAAQPKAPPAPEPGHKERFEQLLDDVVLGVPPKRR